MRSPGRMWASALLVLAASTRPTYAQETVMTGRVIDASEAVIPGVTVTALHIDSGTHIAIPDWEETSTRGRWTRCP
jgi:hypothetical protein